MMLKQLTATSVAGVWLVNEAIYLEQVDTSLYRHALTKEIHLESLGRFPIEAEALSLLQEKIEDPHGNILQVPDLLQKSQIPIFYNSSQSALIAKEAKPICRYFAQSWSEDFFVEENNKVEDNSATSLSEILTGFMIISSFTGLYPMGGSL